VGRAGPSGQLALEISDLRVTYGPTIAVQGVSFSISEGEIFGLLGPNGAGKTSTLSAIEGLVKPASGSINVDGIDARARPGDARARIGVQLQSTKFPEGTDDSGCRAPLLWPVRGFTVEVRCRRTPGGGPARRANGRARSPVAPPTLGANRAYETEWSQRFAHHALDGREAQSVCDRVAIIDHGKIVSLDTPAGLIAKHRDDPQVKRVARGEVTLEDVFIGLTGSELRD